MKQTEDIMFAYNFIDSFSKQIAREMPVGREELIYQLELDRQQKAYTLIAGIGFMLGSVIVLLSFV